ncbi:uncharacterized protein LOC142776013 isoform X1 [Rhipicephalus microplus]|uniref:uncharacterized protein LOC142776013 isoform X1 n=1 Tax=Rhipicephalus microplus TaxID=6941 RepID=UPI003F6C4093
MTLGPSVIKFPADLENLTSSFEKMIGILLLIPAGYEAPNLPGASSICPVNRDFLQQVHAEFTLLEMSLFYNQPGTASTTTCTAHRNLNMALGPDREHTKSEHLSGAIRHDTVSMWSNPLTYWLQVGTHYGKYFHLDIICLIVLLWRQLLCLVFYNLSVS